MSSAGRPRKFDEERVLNTTMETFWEHGYEATSLTQLRDGVDPQQLREAASLLIEQMRTADEA